MKKYLIIAASAAAVLAAGCAKNEVIEGSIPQQAVTFGVYAGQSATKATYGDITTANLQTSADGFSVFAYYTLDADWASTDTPNFMYNQQVRKIDSYAAHSEANPSDYSSARYPSGWYYSPLKYWPNGQNATTYSQNPTSADKLSFYAYAPHIARSDLGTVPATGEGITGISANNATGAPTVTFTVPSKAEEQIDLLWAIPQLNLTKKGLNERVTFNFKHALAKLNFKVQAVVDAISPTTANLQDDGDGSIEHGETWILLESLDVTANGAKTGTLTLDGTTNPNWTTPSGSITVQYTTASFSSTATANGKTGFKATETATELNSSVSPMIIPATVTSGNFTIIAKYWVITMDNALDGYFSTVQNVISTTSTGDITFDAGKKYNITVRLGLNGVDFSATVTDWDGSPADQPFDLPLNTNTTI